MVNQSNLCNNPTQAYVVYYWHSLHITAKCIFGKPHIGKKIRDDFEIFKVFLPLHPLGHNKHKTFKLLLLRESCGNDASFASQGKTLSASVNALHQLVHLTFLCLLLNSCILKCMWNFLELSNLHT